MQETLHIATAVDAAYLVPLRIMIASLMEHLSPHVRPVLHVLNRSLDQGQLKSMTGPVETHSIVVGPELIEALPRQRGFPPEASFPLLLPDLLPESVERVLFLDPDLLVLDNVAKLWEADLGGRVIAAVGDQAIPLCSSPRGVRDWKRHGVPATAPYFNAGVMLMDIARWKRGRVSERARAYMADQDGRMDFFHQEALNAILWDDWLPLDKRWNLIASLTPRRRGPDRLADFDPPGIIHFAGHFKPWQFRIGGPHADTYYGFAARLLDHEIPPDASIPDKILSVYDCYLRDYLYWLERALWERRLI